MLKEPDFDLILRAPTGQTAEGAGAAAWRAHLIGMARDYVVGWENVVDTEGQPVPFQPSYMTDGTIFPSITSALCVFLTAKCEERRQAQLGGAGSRSTRGPRRTSGGPGAGPQTADPAPPSEEKQDSAQPERPTA